MSNKFVLQKIVDKLNENGFQKHTLPNITEEELKPILSEIYQKYHSLGGFENSKNEKWKKVSTEIIQEFNFADIGSINYENIEAEFENQEENENNNEDDSEKSDSVKSKSDDETDKNDEAVKILFKFLKTDDNINPVNNYDDPAKTKNDNPEEENSINSDISQ